jgi:hypothetical protein
MSIMSSPEVHAYETLYTSFSTAILSWDALNACLV